ncbi:MAG: (d)CMP kinase [Candidatus Binataceae bacterium]|nr:(d)CMP kinase [Candidatus Binataceae bacterium]
MKRERPIVAIDGPVGAGKSTIARRVAAEIGFSYLNTGAMYRAVALAAQAAGLTPDRDGIEPQLEPLLHSITIEFAGDRLILNGREVTGELSRPEIGELASRLSTLRIVRDRMRDLQRAAGGRGGVVMEGRDIGSAIFPDAEFKFFLDAEVQVRARRRYEELRAKNVIINFDEVLEQLRQRDNRDSARALAPLIKAPDAMVVDSTDLTIDQVVKQVVKLIKARTEA